MKSLIGKKWVDSLDGKVIEVYNPATNELIDTTDNLTFNMTPNSCILIKEI